MKIIKGISASSGVALGRCCLYQEEVKHSYQSYTIKDSQINNELSRLKQAKANAVASMKGMISSSENVFDAKSSAIYGSHLMILEDKSLYEKIEHLIRDNLINSEHAVNDVFEEYIKRISSKPEHFADLTHDLIDIKDRLLDAFGSLGGKFACSRGEKEAVIVVAKRLTPSLIMSLPRENVLAFITEEGGFTTHATILARNMKVPVIFGVDTESNFQCGNKLIVDGSSGIVISDPDEGAIAKYTQKIAVLNSRKNVCEAKKPHTPVTAAGDRVLLKVNISSPAELNLIKGLTYDGVGLLRTEFLFSDKSRPPTMDEQYRMFRIIAENNPKLPVNVRLLDISSDKMPAYMRLPKQENPDLGIRGARALELFQDIYMAQIEAALLASAHGEIRILLPMVADVIDYDEFAAFIDSAKQKLKSRRARFNEEIKIGVMIETPSAALLAETILEKADFANIGSNDLLQYTLASSRGNADVEKRYHILHPALLKLMQMAVSAGNSRGKEVCLCGEIASFEEYYPLLMSIGIRSFSISVAKYEDIKCEVHHYRGAGNGLLERYNKARYRSEIDALFAG